MGCVCVCVCVIERACKQVRLPQVSQENLRIFEVPEIATLVRSPTSVTGRGSDRIAVLYRTTELAELFEFTLNNHRPLINADRSMYS
jgi:hypothetical protein